MDICICYYGLHIYLLSQSFFFVLFLPFDIVSCEEGHETVLGCCRYRHVFLGVHSRKHRYHLPGSEL